MFLKKSEMMLKKRETNGSSPCSSIAKGREKWPILPGARGAGVGEDG
jgi:hypothetical protein